MTVTVDRQSVKLVPVSMARIRSGFPLAPAYARYWTVMGKVAGERDGCVDVVVYGPTTLGADDRLALMRRRESSQKRFHKPTRLVLK